MKVRRIPTGQTGSRKGNFSGNLFPSHLRTFTQRAKQAKRATAGYALLDVVVALTVFSIWGVSLMSLLREISIQSESYARDRLIQYQLQSFITEARHKPVDEITSEYLDENLNVNFTTTVEALQLANVDGNGLTDLYTVKVIAQFEEKGQPQTETAEVYLYKPAEE